MKTLSLEEHFMFLHNNPPAPFNPDYNPRATDLWGQVSASMQGDKFYSSHTREECRDEWARRYDLLKDGLCAR